MDRWPWQQNRAKYHGLVNQGATCYLNSVLQVLFMTEDFRDTVKRYNATEHIDRELRDLFKALMKCNAKTNNITKKLKIQNVREQRDAAEHYEKILRLTSPEASKIFHGKLMNYNTCKECKTTTGSAAAFWSLPLPLVNSDNYYSVEKGIEDYFRPSEIAGDDQMYCETCDEKRDAVLHCEVSHQPDVLVLLLKRFEFDYRYMTYVKINQPVDVPHTVKIPQQQNNQNQTYNLYAFVEHSGELRYGHYISTIWSQEDDRWYIFDDTNVEQSKTSPTLEGSQSAYLLFYRKQIKAVNEDPNPDPPVKAAQKRSSDNSEDKPAEGKKPKQEPSDEEPPLEQTGQKSPENQDLDVGGCSSSQQTLNTAEGNQDDDSRSDQSPNKDQWNGPDQSESKAFCTGDMRSSNHETLMKAGGDEDGVGEQVHLGANDGIDRHGADLRIEVKGAQEEREESHSINPHVGDGEQIQRDECKTSDKHCCEGNGGSESQQVCPEVNVEQLGNVPTAALSGIGSCYVEEAAKTTENDFSKQFQRQDHQILNPEKAAANRTMQSCKSSADDCIIDIEPSDVMIVDQLEMKPQCALDTEQPSQMSPNQQNIVEDKRDDPGQSESKVLCTQNPQSATCETGENAGDGKHCVGEKSDSGVSYGIEHRSECALKMQVQSGPEGREESYSVKLERVDDVQNQRNLCNNSDKTCCRESTGGHEGLQSCPDADMQAVIVGQRSNQAEVLLEIKRGSEEDVVKTSTEDAESSELKMSTMSQSNNNECVKEQAKDPPGIRNGQEPIEDNLCSQNPQSATCETGENAGDGKHGVGKEFDSGVSYGIEHRSECALKMQVQSGPEGREESYSVKLERVDDVQNQRNLCNNSDKTCCRESTGGHEGLQSCPDADMQAVIVGQRSNQAEVLLEIKRGSEEDVVKTSTEDAESSELKMSTMSQSNNNECVKEQAKDPPGIRNGQEPIEDNLCSQNPQSATCETGENAGDGKHGVGKEFDSGVSYGIEHRSECALKMQVQSGPEGREESYSVKLERVDDVQNQRNLCNNSDKTCCRESTGGHEGLQSCPDADMQAVIVELRDNQAKVLLEMGRDYKKEAVKTSTEDAESSEHKMFTVSQTNYNECVQVQAEDPPGIRNGHEPIEDNLASENDAFQETAKQTELNQNNLNEDEMNTSGLSSESCKNGIENGKSSQEKELYESNDKGAIENVSSDCATGGESVQRGYMGVTNTYEEPSPCFSVSEKQKDLAQSPITMKKEVAEVHSGMNDQREDTGKLERMEGANLLDNGVSMEGQGRTGSGGAVKQVESGSKVERRLTIYRDLYLPSVQNPPKSDSYDKQLTRAKSEIQKVPEAKCPETDCYHNTAKSGIVESERFEQMPVSSSRRDKESEQREIAGQVEGHIETLPRTGFERVDKITEGETEIIKITVNKRQSGNAERQNRRSDMCSVQSDRNAENLTNTIAEDVDNLTIS